LVEANQRKEDQAVYIGVGAVVVILVIILLIILL
jgi:hypothetical protein